jgi:transposase InsO family protein
MKFQFICDHQETFPVQRMCAVLDVSRSGYYAWQARPVSQREMANQELLEQIRAVYAQSHETYGSPRIHRELKGRGISCGENRVARLMRRHGIRAKQAKRYKRTTKANAAHAAAPNRLQGDFGATQPNEKWLADISYIPTAEGWLYLATIMDLFSRRIVGWAMAPRMGSLLVQQALQMAIRQRRPSSGLVHHSDRGSQYTAATYQTLLASQGMQVSMSSTGNCYDNAPMESFFGTLKREWVHHRSYRTREEAQTDLFFY